MEAVCFGDLVCCLNNPLRLPVLQMSDLYAEAGTQIINRVHNEIWILRFMCRKTWLVVAGEKPQIVKAI